MDVAVGVVMAFAGNLLPAGYDWCRGQRVANTDPTYQALFRTIGTIYGGDGAPFFNLPDYRGQFLRGVDHGRNLDPNRALGSNQDSAFASHTHAYVGKFLEASGGSGFNGHGFDSNSRSQDQVFNVLPTGGSETRPTNVAVEFIIKL